MKKNRKNEISVGVMAGVMLCVLFAGHGFAEDAQTPENARNAYEEYCAACHGYDGIPNLPGVPNFSVGESLDKNEAELIESIAKGKGDIMPAWQDILSEDERVAILRYVRSIAGENMSDEN